MSDGPAHGRARVWGKPAWADSVWIVAAAYAAWLGAVLAVAIPLALTRFFQLDEFQNSYVAHLLTSPELDHFAPHVKPYLYLLGSLGSQFSTTTGMMKAGRLAATVFLVANFLLLAWGQPYFRSAWGRLVTLVCATGLFSLWKYGIEIRQDGFILTAELILFGLTQRLVLRREVEPWTLVLGAFVAVTLILNAGKGFVYAVPYAGMLGVLALGFSNSWGARGKVLAWGLLGALSAMAIATLVLWAYGDLLFFIDDFTAFFDKVDGIKRFSFKKRFRKEAQEMVPLLLLALPCAPMALLTLAMRRRVEPALVTATYLIWSVVVVGRLNPTPWIYNILHIAPFVFLAAMDTVDRILPSIKVVRVGAACLATLVMSASLHEGLKSQWGTRNNDPQLDHVRAAEQLTSPSDPVLDGMGLVPTRPPATKDWLLHSALSPAYRRGRREQFRTIISRQAPPVLIKSYRWRWLASLDRMAIKRNYRRVAHDLWVLGVRTKKASGSFRLLREGRYRVRTLGGPPIEGARLDGEPLELEAIRTLGKGIHRFIGAPPGGVEVMWLGPTLSRYPKIRKTPGKRRPF